MYVRCDESSLYSRINYVHSPDGELLWECPGILSDTGFKVHRIALCQRPEDTEETGRYDLVKDLCSVLNALSK